MSDKIVIQPNSAGRPSIRRMQRPSYDFGGSTFFVVPGGVGNRFDRTPVHLTCRKTSIDASVLYIYSGDVAQMDVSSLLLRGLNKNAAGQAIIVLNRERASKCELGRWVNENRKRIEALGRPPFHIRVASSDRSQKEDGVSSTVADRIQERERRHGRGAVTGRQSRGSKH